MASLSRISWLERIATGCFIIQLLLTFRLWTGLGRSFPSVPLFRFVEIEWPPIVNWFWYSVLLIALLGIFFQCQKRKMYWLGFFCAGMLIVADLTRLQVWTYQWLLLLLLLFRLANNPKLLSGTLLLAISAIYMWSGIHKFNVYFQEDTLAWMLEPFYREMLPAWIAWGIALFEIGMGIAILLPRFRKLGLVAVLLFHLAILMCLGPLGHDWNRVVWPWNITMPLFVWMLVTDNELFIDLRWIEYLRKSYLTIAILILFILMPAFNWVDRWPEPLSFKMYAGNNPEGILYFAKPDTACFPESVYLLILPPQNNEASAKHRLVIDTWCLQELGVAPFVSDASLQYLGAKLCECWQNPDLAGLEILKVDRWDKQKDTYLNFPCK